MERPARLRVALVFAAAIHSAAAAPARFVPADPGFVVADVSRAAPDPALRSLVLAVRAQPDSAPARVALAEAFLVRAQSRREPSFIGRAEALLAQPAAASPDERRIYAYTLQYRHDFKRARVLLDHILAANPRDTAARTQRASVQLVVGDFAGARADCARLAAGGDAGTAIGIACLAEALAGMGDLRRANALLATFPLRTDTDAAARAYLLTVRAELAERSGDAAAARTGYAAALALAPQSDPIRAAFADLLHELGDPAAAAALADVDRPSLALLVRQVLAAPAPKRAALRARAAAWLELERDRGDAAHRREAAMLALAAGEFTIALDAARLNFEAQRELPDVRVLARACVAARDAEALRRLREWLAKTGFADAVTENILAAAARG